MNEPASLRPPLRFGRFELLRCIAMGGMAEIFLAADREDPRRSRRRRRGRDARCVVIKRILPQYASHPEFVVYFRNEGRIATQLRHPNVIETYELGEIDGQYYLAMEYFRGETLVSALRRAVDRDDTLPVGFCVDVVRAAALGLSYAHGARGEDGRPLGVVHRDVSPHNILLGFDGRVKLLDFGVAKAAIQDHTTRVGTIKGKLAYVAPEQIRGGPVDARTDVFALGIVLHEALAARQLFKGDSDAHTLERVLRAPIPRLCDLRPDCPPELERIALRALARDPAERYPTARGMADDLGHVRAFLEDPKDVIAGQLARLFPDEAKRADPSPSGSWRGEVMEDPERRPARALAVALRAAVVAAAVALLGGRVQQFGWGLGIGSHAAWRGEPAVAVPLVATAARGQEPAGGAPAAAAAAPSGRLRVSARAGLEIVVDGKPMGRAPLEPVRLAAGPHQVLVRRSPRRAELHRRVVVPAGGEAVLRIEEPERDRP